MKGGFRKMEAAILFVMRKIENHSRKSSAPASLPAAFVQLAASDLGALVKQYPGRAGIGARGDTPNYNGGDHIRRPPP
jgi:hypothetical protein